jgi:hypothetical protein
VKGEDPVGDIARRMISRSLWGLLIVGLIIVVTWTLLDHFLPLGWWITLINVLGFLSTAWVIGVGTWQTLKLVISSGYSFLIALLVWAAMVIGLRTLMFNLLGD